MIPGSTAQPTHPNVLVISWFRSFYYVAAAGGCNFCHGDHGRCSGGLFRWVLEGKELQSSTAFLPTSRLIQLIGLPFLYLTAAEDARLDATPRTTLLLDVLVLRVDFSSHTKEMQATNPAASGLAMSLRKLFYVDNCSRYSVTNGLLTESQERNLEHTRMANRREN